MYNTEKTLYKPFVSWFLTHLMISSSVMISKHLLCLLSGRKYYISVLSNLKKKNGFPQETLDFAHKTSVMVIIWGGRKNFISVLLQGVSWENVIVLWAKAKLVWGTQNCFKSFVCELVNFPLLPCPLRGSVVLSILTRAFPVQQCDLLLNQYSMMHRWRNELASHDCSLKP